MSIRLNSPVVPLLEDTEADVVAETHVVLEIERLGVGEDVEEGQNDGV